MPEQTQISAFISQVTKDRLERFVEAHGLKKGSVVENALLHHLQALEELPADIIISPRIVVTRESFESVVERIRNSRRPTKAMRALFAGTGRGGG